MKILYPACAEHRCFSSLKAAVQKEKELDEAQIEENIKAFIKALEENKPTGVKGKLIKKIYIAPTMGPGIQIEC